MSDGKGPWDLAEAEAPSPATAAPRARLIAWLGVLAAIGVVVALLFKAFPGAIRSKEDWGWVIWGMLFLAFVSTRLLTARRIDWGQKGRHAAIWLGLVLVIALGVAYRPELMGVVQRVRGEFGFGYPVAVGAHELAISQDAQGGFYVMGQVNGQPVRFLVDTGATDTVLSPGDAKRLGIDLDSLAFDQPAQTANGLGYGAKYVAGSVAVGDIRFDGVPVLVNQAPMEDSLLGMTFLSRLESFQVKGTRLYLKSRE